MHSPDRGKSVVVFGSSGCREGSPLYSMAEALGCALAEKKINVVNGGYSGTMEAVSKGARMAGDVEIEGIVVPDLFPNRPPSGNQYLTLATKSTSLMDRLTKLIAASNVYVALPGSVGTLGEVALVWNHINIDFRVHQASKKHLICWRDPFERFFSDTVNSLGLVPLDTKQIYFVNSVDECVKLVDSLLPRDC